MKLNQCTTSPQLGPDLEQDGGQLWHHLPAPDQRSCAQLELQETQPESLVRLLNWILEWRVDKPEGLSFVSSYSALGIQKGFSASNSD